MIEATFKTHVLLSSAYDFLIYIIVLVLISSLSFLSDFNLFEILIGL